MRKVIITFFLCFLSDISFAGCTGPFFSTSIGINSGETSSHGSYSVYVVPGDSFLLTLSGSNCLKYSVREAAIYFNGQLIQEWSTNFSRKLLCTPGVYRFSVTNVGYDTGFWDLELIAKPKIVDTTTVHADTTSSTSLPPLKILNPDFLFYPNPANDELNLLNQTDEIKSVSFYDMTGQLLCIYNVNGVRANIPLNNYSPGFYFVHVATLSDKIIIKKISKS